MLALRQSFKRLLQIKDKTGAAVGPAPAAAAEDETVTPKEGDWEVHTWIPLETWLRNAANSREWDIRDRQAYRTWDGVLRLLAGGYLAIQDERHERGLWCDSLEAKALLVSGTLDLTLPKNEIMAATTLRLDILGSWRRAHLHFDEVAFARGRKDYELNELVEKVVDEHFPQYADWY